MEIEIKDLASADEQVQDKNAAEVQADVNDARELRATPSGYQDRMDIDRSTDTAKVRDGISVADIKAVNRAGRGKKAPLTGFAKSAAVQAAVGAIDGAAVQGKSDEDARLAGLDVISGVRQNSYQIAKNQHPA